MQYKKCDSNNKNSSILKVVAADNNELAAKGLWARRWNEICMKPELLGKYNKTLYIIWGMNF